MPQVSVIIPCFNAQRWIRQTLGSVVAQRVADLEVIVVDDGSTDASAAIVQKEFPFVRLIQIAHGGVSRARNEGTRQASGEYLQYLDSDDLLAEGKLKRQLQLLEEERGDVVYGGWQELVQGSDGAWRPGRVFDRPMEGEPEIALFTGFWAPPAAYLFRRRIVEKVGGWSEHFVVVEDARFVLDCAFHGACFIHDSVKAAYYRVHSGGSLSREDRRGFILHCWRNALEVESRWHAHGGITPRRKVALLEVYGYVARASFEENPALFEKAHAALNRLMPGYIPQSPWHLALVSRLLGYRRAEAVALRYRRGKQWLRDLLPGRSR